jgi:hypothetical protein
VEKENSNFLSIIPERIMEWEINPETDLAVIIKPKFQHPFLKKHLLPRLKKSNYSVKLDKIGSFVWNNIDGKNTINDIAEMMKKEFGDSVEPVYERLEKFINSLVRYNFINIS